MASLYDGSEPSRQFDRVAGCRKDGWVALSENKSALFKYLREANRVGQPVLARYSGTSESTVEKWENEAKRSSGAALKLGVFEQNHCLGVLA